MNKHRTILILFLIMAICACFLPAGAVLPSYSFRGTVTDVSRSDNTVTILVTHKWGCVYDGRETPCSWMTMTPKVLTGTVPVPEVFDKVRVGSSVEAGSIGSQGVKWAGIGVLAPSTASEPLHATDLYGDPGMLPAPLAAGYAVSAENQPDCACCSGSVCEAASANVTISKNDLLVWNGTLGAGGEGYYEDPADGTSVSVTFISGQAPASLCPDTPFGMSGVQPVSVFIVHVSRNGPGPGPTVTPAQPGMLSVSSIPPGAAILLDGVAKGSTPKTISGILPGVHTLSLAKEGYAPYERNITISAGKPVVVTAKLTPLYGSLRIQSAPQGASVLLNGTDAGVTPLVIANLVPGTYTVSLSKTGYQASNQTATVVAGQEKVLFVTLTKKGDGSEKIEAFIAALEQEGFTVQKGKFEMFDVLAM
jgi:hypothetical protein